MGTVVKRDINIKRKVLFLLEAFDKGGIEKVTLDIVNNLDPDKYDVTVQTFMYGGDCQSLVNPNVKVIPFFFKRYVRGIIRLIAYLPPKLLYRLFVRGRYDVEIAASDGGAAKVISGSTNKKSRKICWVHMDVVERGSMLKEFKSAETAKPIYDKFDLIVPVSNACAEKFKQKFGNDYPFVVVHNPLPVSEIIHKSNEAFKFSKAEGLNIVCIGRLVEQKGFDRLLKASERIIDDGIKNFRIYIIGEGIEKNTLESFIDHKKLSSYIKLVGYQSNPYKYLKQADMFLLTSRDEAFPLVIGESLVVGTPVIATNCSGVAEWLGDGKYGIIIENSTEAIYQGLSSVLKNPEILESYRKVIPEAQAKISFENALADFESILV
ncbi:MAG: glycosyltransferase [Ruminococcaceae bacterium]|nr:glycosyltransferase [Oscillospiraceae bacterium]